MLSFSKPDATRHHIACLGAPALLNYFATFLLLIFVATGCQSDKPDKAVIAPPKPPLVQPPLPGADVPFQNYVIDAAEGDTIYAPTGSILYFPPQSLLDDKGKVISGKVTIRFREFADALDQYLAGIPMTYDSAGINYQFVSSAMCEIKAEKDGLPVHVNPAHQPEVHLVTSDGNAQDNLYYFDTAQGGWKYKGRMTISDLSKKSENRATAPVQASEIRPSFTPPVMPEKVTGSSPVMVVKIDPSSFAEFREFNNLKFQIDESVKKFNPKDSAEEWNDLELSRAKDSGKYIIKFRNTSRTVSYTARPVLEGKDLVRAEEIYRQQVEHFNRQLTAYREQQKDTAERLRQNASIRAALTKDDSIALRLSKLVQARNNLITKQNKVTDARNRQVTLQNETVERRNDQIGKKEKMLVRAAIAENDSISLRLTALVHTRDILTAEQNKAIAARDRKNVPVNKDSEKRDAEIAEREKMISAIDKQIMIQSRVMDESQKNTAARLGAQSKELYYSQKLYRNFAIPQFGVWNCDGIVPLVFFEVAAGFVDSTGNTLNLTQVSGVIRDINALIQKDDQVIFLTQGEDMMIWGVVNNKFAYLDYSSYRKLGLTPATKKFSFTMKIVPAEKSNYQYLRALIKP